MGKKVKTPENDSSKELRKLVKTYQQDKDVQMVLRLKVIIAYLTGKTAQSIAKYFDVSAKTIKRWIKAYETGGVEALQPKPKAGRTPKLNNEALQTLRNKIVSAKERVWVARHVYTLIIMMFSVIYSVKYIPELLKKINLSFHKATHYLIKKNEEKRAKWIQETLPEIYSEHIKDGWRVLFQDEVGFQTEGTLSYSWAPVGQAISINNKGRHGRVNLMGVYEVGSGDFFYRMTLFKVNALRFKRFLCCLKRKYKTDKFIIIADNASFHKSKWFTKWWEETNWLQIRFLPAYSPDFNPIERLWKWIKREYTHNKCWASKSELLKYLKVSLSEMASNVSAYIGTMRRELWRLKKACEHHAVSFIWEEYLPKAA